MDTLEPDVRARFEDQQHILDCFDALPSGSEAKRQLAATLRGIDMTAVRNIHRQAAMKHGRVGLSESCDERIEPVEHVDSLAGASSDQLEQWNRRGLELVRRGAVAAVLMSGGQGTRLGSTLPKGMYDMSLQSGKTLFQLQAERLLRVRQLAIEQLAAEQSNSNGVGHSAAPSSVPYVPWFIMTSPTTDAPAREFFREHNYFGIPADSVVFFVQEDFPCTTPDGKLMMESAERLALAPNGNGGLYAALDRSGCLARMQEQHIKHVFVYGVDNILCRVADPVFFGWFDQQDAECGCKVVPKRNAHELVGVVCRRGGRAGVLEYSEIPTELSEATNPDGSLVLNTANIAMHVFRRSFLQRVVVNRLGEMVHHMARKKIPYYDVEQRQTVTPSDINGWKYELFIFDVFLFANRLVALEVDRTAEFSPLKNASGSPNDSPETCREHLNALHRKYAAQAGASVSGPVDALFEISPLLTFAGEGLGWMKDKTFTAPMHVDAAAQQ